jgi:outer membrane immunogenic protein
MVAGSAAAQTAASDWSGLYGGLNGGWNWGRLSSEGSGFTTNQLSGVSAGAGAVSVPPATVVGRRPDVSEGGFQGGGQLGFNAVAGPVVWGLEGDFDGMTNRYKSYETFHLPATALTTGSTVVAQQRVTPRWEASIRGRLGLASGRKLLYVTGGPAWVRMRQVTSYSYAPTVTGAVAAANPGTTFGPYSNSFQDAGTRRGWTVGAGAEFMKTANMTFGLEYRHTWVGRFAADPATSAPDAVFETGRTRWHDNAVLAKVNLKFGGGGLGHWF